MTEGKADRKGGTVYEALKSRPGVAGLLGSPVSAGDVGAALNIDPDAAARALEALDPAVAR